MKSLVLSGASFVLLVALSMVFFRTLREKHYRTLIVEFLFCSALYCVAYRATPADLGFLPGSWLEPHATVDFASGLLVLAMLFHCFWDTVYLLYAGFSANMMVLISQEALTADQLLRMHGSGQKFDKLLAWRLPGLVESGYLEKDGEGYRARGRGRFLGATTLFLKRLLTGRAEGG